MAFVNKKFDNFTMVLNPRDKGISGVLMKNGKREQAFMKVMSDSIKKDDICIDLGANIGYATLHMAINAKKVYAIEPDPRNIILLEKNLEINKNFNNCEIHKIAISDYDGELSFWQAATPNTSSVHKTSRSQNKITVQCKNLGSFLKEKSYPNFIKMDVEGHEVKVLKGAYDYFSKNQGRTNILIEVHPSFYDDDENNFSEILKKYFEIGFNSKYVISTPVAQPKIFEENGYFPVESIKTDGFTRGIYNNISNEDLVSFSCFEHEEPCIKSGKTIVSKKVVRSFMIGRD